MPELPEVETYRRFLDELTLRVPITGVQVLDAQVLTSTEAALRAGLVGRHFTRSRRVGKNLLLELGPPPGASG